MGYFTDNKELIVITEDGRELKQECESSEPDKQKFEAIRKAEEYGEATFTDVVTYTTEESFKAVEAKLLYDGEKVAYRKLPPITVTPSTSFELSFVLKINGKGGEPQIEQRTESESK
jgi:hypothetical protein